jgi:pimeloyl-ACP methyl ester carboxylesterase
MPFFMAVLKVPLLPKVAMKLFPERLCVKLAGKFFYHPSIGMSRGAVEDYSKGLASPGAHDSIIATTKGLVPDDLAELTSSYPRISVPTQIIWGIQDRVIPVELGCRLSGEIPNANLHEIDACGHCPQEEKPEETISVIRRFLWIGSSDS